jgi:DNA-directed RNA polymerase sigma subunit (sigma70/sigma32)
MKSPTHNNCAIIAAKSGPMTLQEIGEVFDVTRMRICQIEKTILKKLADHTEDLA